MLNLRFPPLHAQEVIDALKLSPHPEGGYYRGGFYAPGAPAAGLEHQESHLKAMLGFIGLKDVTIINADGMAVPDAKAPSLEAAHASIATLA